MPIELKSQSLYKSEHCSSSFLGVSSEDVCRICPVRLEQRELDGLHYQLDSLDDAPLAAFVGRTLQATYGNKASRFPGPSTHSSTLPEHCLYIPPIPYSQSNINNKPIESPPEKCIPRRYISPEIAEDARLEASVLGEVAALKQKGMWSASRLPKVMEPIPRKTAHDCLLKEAVWLAVDFAEERKWKKLVARNLAEAAKNYLILRQQWNEQCSLADEVCRKRNSSIVSHIVKEWWSQIRREITMMKERADGNHFNYLLNQNKLFLMVCSELAPEWLAGALSETLPANSDICTSPTKFTLLRNDGDSDNDWVPTATPDSSTSDVVSTSSDASSFTDQENCTFHGIQEVNSTEHDPDHCNEQENKSVCALVDDADPSAEQASLNLDPKSDEACTTLGGDVFLDEENIDPMEVQELLSEADLSVDRVLQTYAQPPSVPQGRREKTEFASTRASPTTSKHGSSSVGIECADSDIYASTNTLNIDESALPAEAAPSLPADCTTRLSTESVGQPVPMDEERFLDDPGESFSEECAKTAIMAPWMCDADFEVVPGSPAELHHYALLLSPLLKLAASSSLASYTDLLKTAFGPTFRVRMLPSASLGGVVSWLRHAFGRGVPGLLLSSSPISGDAELAIAAHLGQLVVPRTRYPVPIADYDLPRFLNEETGSWGPHLIITPRSCLPTWRSRLSDWCPGLRITYLGLGSRGASVPFAPSGSGRRLQTAVSRGAVNVCITTYAAVRSRPNRYNRIMWNVVVFDQVHHILPCSDFPRSSNGSAQSPTELHHQDEDLTSELSSSLIDLLASEIKYTGHRILISSIPDLLCNSCGFRLFELSRLLLSHEPAVGESHQSWTSNLFATIHRVNGLTRDYVADGVRPSKKQMIKFLESFVLRLDEECERETCFDEELIRCPMTSIQQDLHDKVLTTSTARNASKTGDLFDLLKTVSCAAGICNHPVLSDTNPYCCAQFLDLLSSLRSKAHPCPGPFMFDSMLDGFSDCRSGLRFSTPELVLRAVRSERDSELSEVTLQGFGLMDCLKQSPYIRDRIVSLVPSKSQMADVVIPKALSSAGSSPTCPNGDVNLGPFTSASFQGLLPSSHSLRPDNIRSNAKVTNGLPESTVLNLNFADIPVRNKRARVSNTFTFTDESSPLKRQRVNDSLPAPCGAPHGRQTLKQLDVDNKPTLPFLGPDILKVLEKELLEKPKQISGPRKAAKPQELAGTRNGSGSSRPPTKSNVQTDARSGRAPSYTPSIRLECLVQYNERRCVQGIGFSDWCSQSVCSVLRLTGSRAIPVDFMLAPLQDCSSSSLITSVRCARSRVIATSARLSSLRHPSGIPLTSLDRSTLTNSPDAQLPGSLDLTIIERSRWLSPESFCHTSNNLCCSNMQSPCTPLGRLFFESGKFQAIHRLLGELIGPGASRRPRCVFIFAQRSALLDLLEAYLAISPWRHCTRLRAPSNYDAVDAASYRLVDQINHWPRGSNGPLIVLMHSRSPVGCWTGLRAGPDSAVIVVDVDWRADVVDNLRSLLHGWALNGLSDLAPISPTTLSRPLTRIYRLVSFDALDKADRFSSVEACLARGVASRLLPQSVFRAHSTTTKGRHPLVVARVQPNVVNELLFRYVPNEPRLTNADPKSWLTDKELPWPVKLEAPSCSSTSSVTSSFSYPVGDQRRDDSFRDMSEDDFTLFREREPLSEHSLQRMLELFEDPVDIQAWCCSVAEQAAIGRSIFEDHPVDEASSSDSDEEITECGIRPSDLFLVDISRLPEDQTTPNILDEFGYSPRASWEVAYHETCRFADAVTDLVEQRDSLALSYTPLPPLTCLQPANGAEPMDMNGEKCFSDLPIWDPFQLLHLEQQEGVHGDARSLISSAIFEEDTVDTEFGSNAPTSWRTRVSSGSSSYHFDDSDWGYESDPISDCDLPPIVQPVIPVKPAVPTTPVNTTSRPNDRFTARFNTSAAGRRNHGPSLGSFSGHVKRRRVAAGHMIGALKSTPLPLDSGMDISQENLSPSVSAATAIDTDCDSALSPHPGKISAQDGSQSGLLTTSQSMASYATASTAATVVSGTPSSTSYGGILLTLNHLSGTSSKLNIPRVCYNKEMSSSRTNRVRRLNANSAAGTGANYVHADLPKPMSHQSPGSHNPFANPVVFARYGHTSPGRQLQPNPPMRYGTKESMNSASVLGSAAGLSSSFTAPGPVGHLHVGKPLDWLPYEEAALYQSITKLQETPFETTGAVHPSSSPNFRLAEFFINNFFPTRCYRGARQCLLMHATMHSIASTATATLCAGTNNPAGAPGQGTLDDALVPTPSPPTSSTGRKVKNKQKTSAALAPSNFGLVHSQGSSFPTGDIGADNVAAVTRFRTYLAYQFLQNTNNAIAPVLDSGQPVGSLEDSSNTLPPYLTQLFSVIKTTDETQSKYLRKIIRDGLFSPASVAPSQYHRPFSSRRQSSTAFGSSQSATSMGAFYPGSASQASTGGGPGSLFAYSTPSTHLPTGSFLSSVGSGSHATTGPTLLPHQRQRHVALDYGMGSQTSSSSLADLVPGHSGSAPHGGSMIQKNPTHIAALQEHNINPDTLITPAMVIKNKEEREARLLAEASLSGSQPTQAPIVSSLSNPTSATGILPTVQSGTSGFYPTQVNLQPIASASDPSHHTPVFFTIPTDSSVSGNSVVAVTASMPLGFTGNQLSFSHTGQRGPSFVTIVSSNPSSVLRRSATFTSVSQATGQLVETPLNPRISSLQGATHQGSVLSLAGSTISKGSIQTGYFVQQRPQFVGTHAQPLTNVTRGPGTPQSGLSTVPGTLGGTGFGQAVTPISQILRPRGTIRGSVIQPTFVRTITAGTASTLSAGQAGARFAATSGLAAHGRVTFTVPTHSSTMSNNLPTARITSISNIRSSNAATVFQQIRSLSPVGSPNSIPPFSYSSAADSRVHGSIHSSPQTTPVTLSSASTGNPETKPEAPGGRPDFGPTRSHYI